MTRDEMVSRAATAMADWARRHEPLRLWHRKDGEPVGDWDREQARKAIAALDRVQGNTVSLDDVLAFLRHEATRPVEGVDRDLLLMAQEAIGVTADRLEAEFRGGRTNDG